MTARSVVAADTVLTGGTVWCGLGLPTAEAVALFAGRVLATGTADEIAALVGPETRVVDLKGRLATPGLNDAHMHLLPYGTAMAEVDLRPRVAPRLSDVLEAVRARAETLPPGEWVIGRGYDHFRLDVGRHPLREELDEAAPDHPVYIVRTDGHLAVANSRALALAGIDEDTVPPKGGSIEKQNGRLTGLLAETAREPVMAVLPDAQVGDLVDAIERAGRDCLSRGITSVMEAAVGIRDGWTEMLAYQQAHRTGRLPLRVYAVLMGDKGRSIMAEARAAGMVSGGGDDRLRIGPVKIFTDGSAGGRTAAMTKPYLGGDDADRGLLCLDAEELRDMVAEGHRDGYRFAIHAIGDAAIDQVLDAYEAALDAVPDATRRHRIEHCGWLRPDQMARMADRHILPAPQPAFLYHFGDLYLTLLDRERVEASHPMRTWIEAGLHPSASTDCPVVDIDPMANLYTMVTRRTESGTVLGPDQCLSMEEALDAYTRASAYASHEEDIKGRLVPGQLADIAVFDTDLLSCAPEDILTARCDLTILGGVVAFAREDAAR
ncbi:amidohydrolase [Roseivivax isoporae]|uniref:Amidohydrolase n=1 Tax=Roseivivax isoporae LMG 25204 TaxID=1449351 RepID=X7F5X9_9RHOB|nr:amidohydrolase [Roseivivax isoporae]ETX27464.1 amidohydrolase [Roseivivax isoporae LMG 25204]